MYMNVSDLKCIKKRDYSNTNFMAVCSDVSTKVVVIVKKYAFNSFNLVI